MGGCALPLMRSSTVSVVFSTSLEPNRGVAVLLVLLDFSGVAARPWTRMHVFGDIFGAVMNMRGDAGLNQVLNTHCVHG